MSAVGLGCMGLSQAYGPADDEESIATLHRALDLGVSLLDTAMSYGRGRNEQLVGRAIAGRREQAVLATKFGIIRGEDGVRLDGRPEHVRGYCEDSLTRLGVDVIDLYYLHRVDPDVPVADTIGAMAELESSLISERVTAGMKAAESRGRHLGRPGTPQRIVSEIEALATSTDLSIRAIQKKIAGRASRGIVGEITKRARATQPQA